MKTLLALTLIICLIAVQTTRAQIHTQAGYNFFTQPEFLKDYDPADAPLFDAGSRSCFDILDKGNSLADQGAFQASFDTLQHLIQTCYSDAYSFHAFSTLLYDNNNRSKDTSRFRSFEEWLKSVLYLNTDTFYYCADVLSVAGTLANWSDSVHGRDYNAALSVLAYIIRNQRCPSSEVALAGDYVSLRTDQHYLWQDTSRYDTTVNRMDTTFPSLKTMGLELLEGPASVGDPGSTPLLLHARLSKNPFEEKTAVIFELQYQGAVELEIFDALGRVVVGDDRVHILPAGETRLPVNLEGKPSGTYYIRISANGQVTTLACKLQ